MMKLNGPPRSHAFLVEFIICILFFSIASAMLVRVFAASHELRRKSNDLTTITAKIQSIAEYAKGSHSVKEYRACLQKLGAVKEEGKDKEKYIFYYNRDWEPQGNLGYTYTIEIDFISKEFEQGKLLQVIISGVRVNEEEIYEIYKLKVSKYYAIEKLTY